MDYMKDPETADPNIIWDNAFSNAMANMDESLREALPIYKSYAGREGNLLQQMGDPGFWFDDMFDSLAFLASAFATGAAAGAVAKGLQLSKAMVQGAKVYGAMGLNTISESGFEAKDFQDSERNKMAINRHGLEYGSLTETQQNEINEIITPSATNVFRGNVGVLLIPNYIQSRFMFGKLGESAARLRKGVRAGTLSVEDVGVFKSAAKQATVGIFSEGPWEEGMQHALQTYSGRREAFGQNYDDYMLGTANEWVDNLFTTEGQKNMVLGSIIGGIFGGFGGAREKLTEAKIIGQEEMIFQNLKNQLNINDQWYIEHVTRPYKKFINTIEEEDEEGNTIKRQVESYHNEDGMTEYDHEAAQRMFLYGIGNKFLFDEAMVATIDANNLHQDKVNKDALARLYYKYATNPGMDSLDEAESLLLERELAVPKELEDEGVKSNFTPADLKPLRAAFEQAESALRSADDFTQTGTEAKFQRLVAKTLYAEQVKRDQYNEYLANPEISEEQKDSIHELIKDSNEISSALKKSDTRDKLYVDFKKDTNVDDIY